MPYNYEDIKNKLKESKKLVYWLDEKGNILLVDSSKTKSKEKIKKVKYNGILFRFNISFHTGSKAWQGGPIAMHTTVFNKELKELSNVKNTQFDHKNGIIWFDKDYLEMKGWKENYINIAHKILTKKSFKFNIGIYIFSQLF